MAAVGTRGRADGTRVKPGSDAYVGLLGISLLALTTAMLFAYLNWSQISATPKAVQMAPVGGGGGGRMPAPPGAQPNMPAPPPGTPGPGVAQPNVPPVPGQQPGGNVPPPPQQQQKK